MKVDGEQNPASKMGSANFKLPVRGTSHPRAHPSESRLAMMVTTHRPTPSAISHRSLLSRAGGVEPGFSGGHVLQLPTAHDCSGPLGQN